MFLKRISVFPLYYLQILIYRRNKGGVNTMCTWFYAEKSVLSPIITKAQQLPLADTIRNTMSC